MNTTSLENQVAATRGSKKVEKEIHFVLASVHMVFKEGVYEILQVN